MHDDDIRDGKALDHTRWCEQHRRSQHGLSRLARLRKKSGPSTGDGIISVRVAGLKHCGSASRGKTSPTHEIRRKRTTINIALFLPHLSVFCGCRAEEHLLAETLEICQNREGGQPAGRVTVEQRGRVWQNDVS